MHHSGWCSGDEAVLLANVTSCTVDSVLGTLFLLTAGLLTVLYLQNVKNARTRLQHVEEARTPSRRAFLWCLSGTAFLGLSHVFMTLLQLYSDPSGEVWGNIALHPSKVFFQMSAIMLYVLLALMLTIGDCHMVPVPRCQPLIWFLASAYTAQTIVVLRAHEDSEDIFWSVFIAVGQTLVAVGAAVLTSLRKPQQQRPSPLEAPLLPDEEAPPPRTGPKLKPEGSWVSAVGKSLRYVWPRTPLLQAQALLCVLIVVVVRFLNLAVPYFYKSMVDVLASITAKAQGSDAQHVTFMQAFYPWVLLYLVAWFLQGGGGIGGVGLMSNLRSYLWIPISQDAEKRIAVEAFDHMLHLDLSFHLKRKTGELIRIMDRGTGSMKTLLSVFLFSIGPAIFDVLAASAYLFTQEPWMAVVVLVSIAFYVPITILITEYRGNLRREMNAMDNKKSSKVTDALLNYETVKYFTNEGHETDNYSASIVSYQAAEYRMMVSLNALNMAQCAIMFCGIGSGMTICISRVAKGDLTVGDTVLFVTLMQQLYAPLNYFGTYYRTIQQYMIDMENMFDLLAMRSVVRDAPAAPALRLSAGDIEFRNVGFAYDPARPVLKSVSFKVKGGQTVAFVGATGSGKSTILRLLFRFYDPTSGAILFDGQDIRTVQQRSLRQHIGVVPQDTVLFNDSIQYNIAYGRPGATSQDVRDASAAAVLHESVTTRFPNQYDTVVGERGLRLSGGEKQRVAFARAILKNPPILILDEATSALDSITERQIQECLGAMRESRTMVVVAHRLSTVMEADLIVVLEHGEVVESGSHAELVQREGLYHRMWTRQLTSPSVDDLAGQVADQAAVDAH